MFELKVTPNNGCLGEFCSTMGDKMSEAARAGSGYSSAMATGWQIMEQCVKVQGCITNADSEAFVAMEITEDGRVNFGDTANA